MTEAEARRCERRKCAEELMSLAEAHRACAADGDISAEDAALHREKAATIGLCAGRLLDWMTDPAA